MVGQNKSWDEILLQEREENSRLRQQQRDQAERERRLVERLAQLKEQQHALQQGKTVDAVGRDGKIKALQVRSYADFGFPITAFAEHMCPMNFRPAISGSNRCAANREALCASLHLNRTSSPI